MKNTESKESTFKLIREDLNSGEKVILKECKSENVGVKEFNKNFDLHIEKFIEVAIENKQSLDPDKLLESYRKINKTNVIYLEDPQGEALESFIPVKTCYKRHIVELLNKFNAKKDE